MKKLSFALSALCLLLLAGCNNRVDKTPAQMEQDIEAPLHQRATH